MEERESDRQSVIPAQTNTRSKETPHGVSLVHSHWYGPVPSAEICYDDKEMHLLNRDDRPALALNKDMAGRGAGRP
jgi:hypothetical protein